MSAKKKIPMRLYKRHDMDLLTLYKTPDFSLHKAIYNSLKAYIHKQIYMIQMPETTVDMSKKDFCSHYQLCLSFDCEKDADVLNWFKTLKPNMRTQAIKAVVRGCLIGTTVFACIKNDEDRIENINLTKNIESKIPNLSKTPLTAKADRERTRLLKKQEKERLKAEKEAQKKSKKQTAKNNQVAKNSVPVNKSDLTNENKDNYKNNINNLNKAAANNNNNNNNGVNNNNSMEDFKLPEYLTETTKPGKKNVTTIENTTEKSTVENQNQYDYNNFAGFGDNLSEPQERQTQDTQTQDATQQSQATAQSQPAPDFSSFFTSINSNNATTENNNNNDDDDDFDMFGSITSLLDQV